MSDYGISSHWYDILKRETQKEAIDNYEWYSKDVEEGQQKKLLERFEEGRTSSREGKTQNPGMGGQRRGLSNRSIERTLGRREITVKVNSFLFGQGKTEDINIYEIISNKKQGDDFFDNSKVQKIGQFEFIIENYQSEETNLEMEWWEWGIARNELKQQKKTIL